MTARGADRRHLETAARLALRGEGGAEPNPLVGCVMVAAGAVVGWGFHRRCGGPHAEIEALRRAGDRARGATAYVTLEPCNHHGRTGPCAEALLEAGVARVVYAVTDPGREAGGGAERLRRGGVEVAQVEIPAAVEVTAPHLHRVATGLPWVIAKWAQTADGRIAARTGASRWISSDASRRMVHRWRGRVDAVLTGIGTVRADDPALTARCVRRRRVARRVVVDPRAETPPASQLVATAGEAPLTILCGAPAAPDVAARAEALRRPGVEVIEVPAAGGLPLDAALRALVARHGTATVLVEAGPGLLGRLFAAGLVNEARVFVAPVVFGDERAPGPARGRQVDAVTDGLPMTLRGVRRRGDDVLLCYRVG